MNEPEIGHLIHKVIGAAYAVHNALGAGFLESVYEKSLQIELAEQSIKVETQKPLQVYYKTHLVGEFKADLLVADVLLVELKAVNSLILAHEVQLVNYLAATRIDDGLLINFGKRVDVKRKYRKYTSQKP